MRKVRRSFLLIETFISLSLLALLIGGIGFWQFNFYQRSKKTEKFYQFVLEENIAYKRLRNIFKDVISSAEYENLPSHQINILSFVFHRGVYQDPRLSGNIIGQLIYDKADKEIQLVMANLENTDYTETITILDKVEDFDIHNYFSSNDKRIPETMIWRIVRHCHNKDKEVIFVLRVGK